LKLNDLFKLENVKLVYTVLFTDHNIYRYFPSITMRKLVIFQNAQPEQQHITLAYYTIHSSVSHKKLQKSIKYEGVTI